MKVTRTSGSLVHVLLTEVVLVLLLVFFFLLTGKRFTLNALQWFTMTDSFPYQVNLSLLPQFLATFSVLTSRFLIIYGTFAFIDLTALLVLPLFSSLLLQTLHLKQCLHFTLKSKTSLVSTETIKTNPKMS